VRLRLHHRIVLIMAALAVAFTAVVALVARSVTTGTLSRHFQRDVSDTARVVSRAGFAANAGILTTVKQVTGAEVVTFDDRGLLVTTLEPGVREAVVGRVMAGFAGLQLNTESPVEVLLPGAPPFHAAYMRVRDRPNTTVVLLLDNSEIEAANRAVTRAILGGAAASLVLMIIASQFVARRVTQPISRLAAFADNVSAPGIQGRAPSGDDEVGRLGAAFNEMLDRLEHSQATAVRSEKLVLAGMFAARVAHDVRNPLSSMKLQTQLLQAQSAPGSEARAMTDAMLLDIEQVEFVVANLLELARPAQLLRTRQDVNAILDGVIRQVKPQCDHRHITIVRELAGTLPALHLDAPRFTQALLNVVVNATEALREHGTLWVRSRLSPDGGDVIVDVDDDGVGLSDPTGGRLFDPFVSTKPDGVGLGLVNAKSAVESHGGTIRLEARHPAGTRATITLPVAAPPVDSNG
jgi:signal transduction histidine kinase